MSVIYFKFKNETNYKEVEFSGDMIKLEDLKNLILEKIGNAAKLGEQRRQDILIYNADDNDQSYPAGTRIRKNTQVEISRRTINDPQMARDNNRQSFCKNCKQKKQYTHKLQCCKEDVCRGCDNMIKEEGRCNFCNHKFQVPQNIPYVFMPQEELQKLFQNAKFFVMRSINKENIVISFNHNKWATTTSIEKKLVEAYQKSQNVILIFALSKPFQILGCARMEEEPPTYQTEQERRLWQNVSNIKLGNNFKIRWLRICKPGYSCQEIGKESPEISPDEGYKMCLNLPQPIQPIQSIQPLAETSINSSNMTGSNHGLRARLPTDSGHVSENPRQPVQPQSQKQVPQTIPVAQTAAQQPDSGLPKIVKKESYHDDLFEETIELKPLLDQRKPTSTQNSPENSQPQPLSPELPVNCSVEELKPNGASTPTMLQKSDDLPDLQNSQGTQLQPADQTNTRRDESQVINTQAMEEEQLPSKNQANEVTAQPSTEQLISQEQNTTTPRLEARKSSPSLSLSREESPHNNEIESEQNDKDNQPGNQNQQKEGRENQELSHQEKKLEDSGPETRESLSRKSSQNLVQNQRQYQPRQQNPAVNQPYPQHPQQHPSLPNQVQRPQFLPQQYQVPLGQFNSQPVDSLMLRDLHMHRFPMPQMHPQMLFSPQQVYQIMNAHGIPYPQNPQMMQQFEQWWAQYIQGVLQHQHQLSMQQQTQQRWEDSRDRRSGHRDHSQRRKRSSERRRKSSRSKTPNRGGDKKQSKKSKHSTRHRSSSSHERSPDHSSDSHRSYDRRRDNRKKDSRRYSKEKQRNRSRSYSNHRKSKSHRQ